MRTVASSLLLLLLAATIAGATPRTFVLVIDGMEPENVSRDLTPFLCDLSKCDGQDLTGIGAKATSYSNAQAVVTTTTNANHAAMVTGVYAEKNGIVANSFFDRSVGFSKRTDNIGLLTAETIFTTIKRANRSDVTTAGVVGKGKIGRLLMQCGNPSGCGPALNLAPDYVIQGTAPNNCAIDPADPKLEQRVESCLLVGEPATSDDRSTDTQVMNLMLLLSQTHDPTVFFVNLPDVDNYQHVFGVRSPVALAVIANVDKQIARLVQYLELTGKWDDAVLIITADHSFGDVGDPLPQGNADDGSAPTFSLTSRDVRVNNPITGRPELGITNTRIVMPTLLAGCDASVGPCPTAAGAAPDLCAQLYDTGMAGIIATSLAGTAALACAAGKAAARPDCISGVFWNPVTTAPPVGAVPFLADWGLDTNRAADLVFAAKDRCALLDSQTSTSSVLSGDHGHLTARHIPFIVAGGPDSPVIDAGGIDSGPQAENVDIAPSILAIYGITPPANIDGRVLAESLNVGN